MDDLNTWLRKSVKMADYNNPILTKMLGRKSIRKAVNITLWIVSMLVLLLCFVLVKSSGKIAEEIGEMTVTVIDTVTVRDTVVVEKAMDVCPVCEKPINFKIGKDPIQCPHCEARLLRLKPDGKIFTIEEW